MKPTRILPHLAAAVITATSAQAAIIDVPNYSFTPDGSLGQSNKFLR